VSATGRNLTPRDPDDFYPTPAPLIAAALDRVTLTGTPGASLTILDPGAGRGEWGKAARLRWPDARLIGIDLTHDAPTSGAYDQWIRGDFLTWAAGYDRDREGLIDLAIGNPPYKLAEQFIRLSARLVGPGGLIGFLLRLGMLEGIKRGAGLWRELPPARESVCTARPSFTGNRKTDMAAYGFFEWRIGAHGKPALDWLHWQPDRAKGIAYEQTRQRDRAGLYSGAA
jgi:hypothetical protein